MNKPKIYTQKYWSHSGVYYRWLVYLGPRELFGQANCPSWRCAIEFVEEIYKIRKEAKGNESR